MQQSCDRKLKLICERSALNQSIVPVFICDSELLVALKSFGAKKKFRHPQINTSMKPCISDKACDRILSGEKTFCTNFERNGISAYVVVISGSVSDTVYHAFVIEPQIIFLPSFGKWYVTEAFDSLVLALDRLMREPSSHTDRLEVCYMRVARLCSFFAPKTPSAKTEIVRDLKAIISMCTEPLSIVGGSAVFDIQGDMCIRTCCMSEQVYMLTSSILVAAVPMSANGQVRISCSLSETGDVVEVTHTFLPHSDCGEGINDIDSLINCAPYLRLELAALKDMSTSCGFEFGCKSENGELTVFYRICGEKISDVELGSDTPSCEAAEYIHSLFNSLCLTLQDEKEHPRADRAHS